MFEIKYLIEKAPIICIFFAAIIFSIRRLIRKEPFNLGDCTIFCFGAAILPPALILLASALNQSYLKLLSNPGVYIAVSGIALLYVGCVTIKQKW